MKRVSSESDTIVYYVRHSLWDRNIYKNIRNGFFLEASSFSFAIAFFSSCCFRNRKKEWMEKENSTLRVQDCSFPFQIATQIIKIEMIEKWKTCFALPAFFVFLFAADRFYIFFSPPFRSRVWVERKWHNWGIIGLRCLRFLSLLCTLRSGSCPRSAQTFIFLNRRREKKRAENWLTDNWQLSISASTSAQPVVKSFRLNSRVLFPSSAPKKTFRWACEQRKLYRYAELVARFCQGRRRDVSCCVRRFADMRRTNKYKTHK